MIATVGNIEMLAFSVDEVSKKTTLSKPYIRKKIREGNLKVTRFGRRVLISRQSLEDFLRKGSE